MAAQGEEAQARALNERLMQVHDAMFVESNPIPVKYALARMELMESGIRLPLTVLDPAYHGQVDQALSAFDLL